MLCDECKSRVATVHVTKIINNHKSEWHLCEECAKASGGIGFSFEPGFSVHDILKGMLESQPFIVNTTQKREPVCPVCGMKYAEFMQSGKLGCGACYSAFGELLEPLLRRVQGGNRHAGKVPCRTGGTLHFQRKLQQLKEELAASVKAENYEQAAKLRDEIKALEQKLTGNESGAGR